MRIYRQCPLNDANAAANADYAVVFIGGFIDWLIGVSWRQYRDFEGFDLPMKGLKGFYHWDGGHLGMLADGCHGIADDLNALLAVKPDLHLILVGHSYGGSAAMEVARHLTGVRGGALMVLTLDAVSRRQSCARAPGVDFWGNAFLFRGGGFLDVVPRIGGRWGSCPDADVNLPYDGYIRDRAGNLYSHRRPASMLREAPIGEQTGESLLEMVGKRLGELSARIGV